MNEAKYVSLWEVYLYHGTKKRFSDWKNILLDEIDQVFSISECVYEDSKQKSSGGRKRTDFIITEKCAEIIRKNHRKIKIEPWMYRTREKMDEHLASLNYKEIKKQIYIPEEFLIEVINDHYFYDMKKTNTSYKTFQYPLGAINALKKRIETWNLPAEIELRKKKEIDRNNKKSEK